MVVHDGWGVNDETREVQRFAPGSWKGEHVALSEPELIIEDYRRLINDELDLADEIKAHRPQMVSMRHEEPSE
jgi:hypothetical protein